MWRAANWGILFAGATLIGLGLADPAPCPAQTPQGDLPVLTDGVSRSISWENRTGAPGAGGKAGGGRKGSPAVRDIAEGATVTLMDIDGCGVIRHIWMTVSSREPKALRNLILRMYWDGEKIPSVEVPLGDFFGLAHGHAVELSSAWTTMPRARGFNCFFPMPFSKHAKVTIQNDTGKKLGAIYFQIDYELMPSFAQNVGRFHAQFRRQNPTTTLEDFVIVDNVSGPGMYVGTVIGIRPLEGNWWGEGEIKFYMDGDTEFPTICGTGTEDYLCTGYGMGLYQTPYHGCPLYHYHNSAEYPHGLIGMYRWHVLDPIRYRRSLKVTIQQIGWKGKGLCERADDWCSVAYWYQQEPHNPFPELPDRAARSADITKVPKKK